MKTQKQIQIANSEVRIDPYNSSRPYWVWWEGCEPFACTANEAEAQLWCAFLCGSYAKYQDQRTSFASNHPMRKSQDLKRADFELLPDDVRAYILKDLQDCRLQNLQERVFDVLGTRPEIDNNPCNPNEKYLHLGPVECYAETFWALRRDCTKFTVGMNTGDDFNDLLETQAHLEAALKFATLCFEVKASTELTLENESEATP